METIDERMEEHVLASTTKPIKKFNSRIFKSESAFELFDSILSEVNAHYLREASFLFRKMQQEKFIFSEVTVQEMYLWINESYSIPDLDRLLTLDECSKITRERIYRERKLSLNLKKQV
jgi:outer membrane protein assembly factor BamD (BamD/ComL family)